MVPLADRSSGIGDADQVGRRVDVLGAAGIAALDERDEVGPGAQECPGPRVAGGQGGHFGPVLAGHEHGVARFPVVCGHRHAGAAAVRGNQPCHRLRPHQWLVCERHHHRAYVGGIGSRRPVRFSLWRRAQDAEGGAERGAHAGPPFVVVDSVCPAQLDGGSAGDDHDRIRAARAQQGDAVLGQGLSVELDERLGTAEPGSFPRGEQDPRD